ncbi:helix-turn-helix domain-containing protein [Roseateles sp. LKC17W]|uniref:Helix-turn-helix domain-containing protein n=1 Tax=Pelomonas margarita TaxID=3299031 RepID=A0ABW7FHY7_9BURK
MQPISEGREPQPATAGAWLRQARQQRGLHIAALAVMLKVPQAKLEALESDRYDELPDATFARALATAMCRALKVDAGPVLALLPSTRDQQFDMRPGLNQPFRERTGSAVLDGAVLAALLRPVVWGPLLLVAAAAAIYWIPAGWLPQGGGASQPEGVAPASGVVTSVASAPVVEFVPAPPAPLAASAASTLASSPAMVPAAASAPAPTPAPVAAAVVTGAATLRLSAAADSWVEVADAKGQVLLSRLLRQGEQQEFSGAAPYKLRIGNVGGTRIEWRGAAVDLAASATNNVARLELK